MNNNSQKAYNKRREALTIQGTKKQRRKKYKEIVKELGVRNITLENIAKEEKMPGFLDMLDKTNATLDDAVIIQQYAKAVIQQDTKAAEFIRDTAGEKPSTQVDITGDETGLSKLSLDDLMELRELLKNSQKTD